MKMGFDNGNRASYAIYHIKGGGGVYSIGCSGIRFSSLYTSIKGRSQGKSKTRCIYRCRFNSSSYSGSTRKSKVNSVEGSRGVPWLSSVLIGANDLVYRDIQYQQIRSLPSIISSTKSKVYSRRR